eukprot:gnl/Trimastix_PCT/3061.p1 GENE.gnl/Trimastix_PCT/3061~~gnl/Trimastix_PCT/3061.p1  ORF type:complete len:966 (+),score=375.44 gnl/Trimastix_PCT/3061:26-2923(+)
MKPQKSGPIYRVGCVALLCLLFLDTLVQIVFTTIPDPAMRVLVYATEDFVPGGSNVEANLWIGVALNILVILICIICIPVTIRGFSRQSNRLFSVVVLFKVLSILLLLVNVVDPNTVHTVWFFIMLMLHVPEIAVLIAFVILFSRHKRIERRRMFEEEELAAADYAGRLEETFNHVSHWFYVQSVRRRIHSKFKVSKYIFLLPVFLLFLLTAGTFIFELKKIFNEQGAFYPAKQLHAMNADRAHWPTVAPASGLKVVLVILDGLRYDYVDANPVLKALQARPDFVRDSKFYASSNEIPTMSVPNWMVFLTGAPPEISGVLGNLLVGETALDSIFREAKNYGINRGLTASPWMGGIIKSTMPLLHGTGTISTNYGADNVQHPTADRADWERLRVALEAFRAQPEYKLFLAHFSDIDLQGHAYGVKTRWNRHDTYNLAVSNKTRIVEEMLAQADDQTLFIITSDHGQVDSGGHGGVSPALRKVPLWLYLRGSNLSATSYAGPHYAREPGTVHNVDVAPSICALLGLPVPRQTTGYFMRDILGLLPQENITAYWADLFLQKQKMTYAFVRKTVPQHLSDPMFRLERNDTAAWNATQYVAALKHLEGVYTHARADAYRFQIVRNVLASVGIAIVLFVVFVFVVQTQTFCSPLSLFVPNSAERAHHKLESLQRDGVPHLQGADLQQLARERVAMRREIKKKNLIGLGIALGSVLFYYVIAVGVFWISYGIFGVSEWDSTMIHTPEVLPRYFLSSMLPGFLAAAIFARAYHAAFTRPKIRPGTPALQRLGRRIAWITIGVFSGRSQLDMQYLVKSYILVFTVLAQLLLFVLQAPYTFIVPLIFRVGLIDGDMWIYRFRMLTLLFMSSPLLLISLLDMLLWRDFSPLGPEYDRLFLLSVTKNALVFPGNAQFPRHRALLLGLRERELAASLRTACKTPLLPEHDLPAEEPDTSAPYQSAVQAASIHASENKV